MTESIRDIFKFAKFDTDTDIPDITYVDKCPINDDLNGLSLDSTLREDSKEYVIADVYRYLVAIEDHMAYFDDRWNVEIETWSAHNWLKQSNPWQALFSQAWLTDPKESDNPPPYYFRPSLWLLNLEWMQQQGFSSAANVVQSITFRDSVPYQI